MVLLSAVRATALRCALLCGRDDEPSLPLPPTRSATTRASPTHSKCSGHRRGPVPVQLHREPHRGVAGWHQPGCGRCQPSLEGERLSPRTLTLALQTRDLPGESCGQQFYTHPPTCPQILGKLSDAVSERYPVTHIAGNGETTRSNAFPQTTGDARNAPIGDVLGLAADTRPIRNASLDVYFTERVRGASGSYLFRDAGSRLFLHAARHHATFAGHRVHPPPVQASGRAVDSQHPLLIPGACQQHPRCLRGQGGGDAC